MLYDAILIDVFNLIYKKKHLGTDAKGIANAVIDFIETSIKPKLEGDSSKVFLLFDPMPLNDLNLSSQFRTFTSTRKSLRASYKANREKDPIVIDTADLLKKYFSYRDSAYYLVSSEKHEADDFVESLVKGAKKALLFSTDYDWARYLSDKVEMSLGNVNEPFTVKDFIEKFGYFPSIKNVTVNKALFGDVSDNVDGIFSTKFPFKDDLGQKAMEHISKTNESLDAFLERTKKYSFKFLFELKNRDPEQELFYQMHCFEKKNLLSHFFLNISLIRSLCADASKFIKHYTKKDVGFCTLIDKTLGRGDTVKKPFRFGKVKL